MYGIMVMVSPWWSTMRCGHGDHHGEGPWWMIKPCAVCTEGVNEFPGWKIVRKLVKKVILIPI